MECKTCEVSPLTILSLPVEILVHIVSFLSSARDKVKLRYVSQRLRVVSETPSLWSEFMWQRYDCRENGSIVHMLRACGGYIKRLIFHSSPNHVTPSTLFEMLNHCNKLTHLSLPPGTKLDFENLRTALQHMKSLTHLEVNLGTASKPFSISRLEKLTLHVSEDVNLGLLETWISEGCLPCTLILVMTEWITFSSVFKVGLLNPLIIHIAAINYIPKEHMCHFKLFNILRVPLDLFPSLPHFQVKFGQTASLPFVKASWFGILGLDWDLLVLTDCVCDGEVYYRAEVACWNAFASYQDSMLNKTIDSLKCVTEFDFPYHNDCASSLLSGHLEQLAVACPNLQRLSLRGNSHCLMSLKGLRMIAHCCHDLSGLNLDLISIVAVENQLGLWEILSIMKLTHLLVDACLFQPIVYDDSYEENLYSLFQKFSSLQALQLSNCYVYEIIYESDSKYRIKWSLLAYFPTLKYCRIDDALESTVLHDAISSCKELVCLSCTSVRTLMSPVYHSTLQQLCIAANVDLHDEFLKAISAHGGLVHVVFSMKSITVKGITSLVKNSTSLLTLIILTVYSIHGEDGSKVESKDALYNLKKTFPNRKLFTGGECRLLQNYNESYMKLFKFLYGTDLLPLWL